MGDRRQPQKGLRSVLAGREKTPAGETLEYFWAAGDLGDLGPFEGVIVERRDRFGQRWQLLLTRSDYVTARVAALLLGVTPMTVTRWLNAGQLTKKQKDGVMVIPVVEIEKLARARGVQLPFSQ